MTVGFYNFIILYHIYWVKRQKPEADHSASVFNQGFKVSMN